MRTPSLKSAEYADNRISLFSAQWGKCAITGREFTTLADIHCHHKLPVSLGGTDAYENLVLVLEPIHKLIHASTEKTIEKYLNVLKLTKEEIEKVNSLRVLASLKPICC